MTNQIIRHIDGHALYECEAGSLREAVEQAVREEVSLEGANLMGADLRWAYLGGARLGWADLVGARLVGAYLGGARLGGADLGGAHLGGAHLVDAGQNSRGYRFVGVPTDGLRIAAGCRWFTLNEALAHWANNAEALAKVELIAAEAKRRGWIS